MTGVQTCVFRSLRLVLACFPVVVGETGQYAAYAFGFFALMMVLQLVWVALMVVETRGVPLEQVQARLRVG